MSEGAILAIDTAFGPIGVALASMDGRILASETILDALGAQAEKLPPLVERLLRETQLPARELRRIAVTVGPGAFTGVRVGLAFAKGLALALKVPLLGFTTLECLIQQAMTVRPGANCAAIVDARRGEYYAAGFPVCFGPALMTGDEVRAELDQIPRPLVLVGSGASMIGAGDADVLDIRTVDAGELAVFAALVFDPTAFPATPCYLRAPDARLPS